MFCLLFILLHSIIFVLVFHIFLVLVLPTFELPLHLVQILNIISAEIYSGKTYCGHRGVTYHVFKKQKHNLIQH